MLAEKIGQPRAGASTAWVPPDRCDAPRHALPPGQRDDAPEELLAGGPHAAVDEILTDRSADRHQLVGRGEEEEVDNSCQTILGYVVRWVEQGIGVSKVPDIPRRQPHGGPRHPAHLLAAAGQLDPPRDRLRRVRRGLAATHGRGRRRPERRRRRLPEHGPERRGVHRLAGRPRAHPGGHHAALATPSRSAPPSARVQGRERQPGTGVGEAHRPPPARRSHGEATDGARTTTPPPARATGRAAASSRERRDRVGVASGWGGVKPVAGQASDRPPPPAGSPPRRPCGLW